MPSGVDLKGGGRAIAFRIEFLLDRDELVSALAWQQRDTGSSEPLPELSNAAVERAVRSTLRHAGVEAYAYWSDGMSDARVDWVRAWAEELVDRVYGPELATRTCPRCGGPCLYTGSVCEQLR